MQWLHIYITIILLVAVTASVCTWLAKRAAYRLTMLDHPEKEEHKKHRHAIPVLGGVAMFTAWLVIIFAGVICYPLFEAVVHDATARLVAAPRVVLPQLAIIIGGAAAMLLLGLLDDINPLNAFQKLVGQILIALVVAIYGVRVTVFIAYPLATWLITAAWIVVIVNAINFFDNTDGLAAATACIAALIFMFAAGMRQQFFVAVLAASVCGMGLGFLVFNWPPAKIFMGDAGSHLLGYMLAVTGALTTFYSPDAGMTRLSVLIPILVLAVPIFDFFAVILIRAHAGRPIYQGDHSHISHRFLDMGLGKSATIVLVCLLNFIIGVSALTLFWLPPLGAAIILAQAAALLILVTILHAARIGKGESADEIG